MPKNATSKPKTTPKGTKNAGPVQAASTKKPAEARKPVATKKKALRADIVAEATRAKMHLQNLQAAGSGNPKPWNVKAGPFSTVAEMTAYVQGIEFSL